MRIPKSPGREEKLESEQKTSMLMECPQAVADIYKSIKTANVNGGGVTIQSYVSSLLLSASQKDA